MRHIFVRYYMVHIICCVSSIGFQFTSLTINWNNGLSLPIKLPDGTPETDIINQLLEFYESITTPDVDGLEPKGNWELFNADYYLRSVFRIFTQLLIEN